MLTAAAVTNADQRSLISALNAVLFCFVCFLDVLKRTLSGCWTITDIDPLNVIYKVIINIVESK